MPVSTSGDDLVPFRPVRQVATTAAAAPVWGWVGPALTASSGWKGSGLTGWQWLGMFAGIPLGVFAFIAALVLLFSRSGGSGRDRE